MPFAALALTFGAGAQTILFTLAVASTLAKLR